MSRGLNGRLSRGRVAALGEWQGRFARLRALLRLALALVGFGKLACAAVGLGLLQFALDRALRLPLSARAAVLVACAGVLAWVSTSRLLLPLLRRLSEDDLALELAGRWPLPPDLLPTALQFASGPPGGGPGSAVLCGVAIEEAARLAGSFVPSRLVAWGRVRRWALGGVAAVALAAGLIALFPDAARLWVRRDVLLAGVDWPRRTRITLVGLPAFVPRGGDLRIEARVAGVLPSAARTEVRGLETGSVHVVAMERTARDAFSARLERVQEALELTVRAGDGLAGPRVLSVVDRPAVASARLVVRPPAYTAQGPVELAWTAAEFRVPRGSEVSALIESTKPLSDARCVLEGGILVEPQIEHARLASFSFRVEHDVACLFTLVDTLGLESAKPLAARIRAVPDGAPQVSLSAAGIGSTVTAVARVPLALSVTDDWGAGAAWVEWRVESADGPRAGPAIQVYSGPPRRSFEGKATLDLAAEELKPGVRVTVRAAARDNCAVPAPNVGRSAPLVLRVVSKAELRRSLLLRQRDLRRDLEHQIQAVRRFRASLPADTTLTRSVGRALRDASDVLELTARGYRDVLEQMRNNDLLSPAAVVGRLADIVGPLAALARPDGELLGAAGALDGGAEGLPDALRLLQGALEQMERVRGRMMLLEDYSALVASIGEIAAGQREVLDGTQREQRRALDELLGE